MTDDVYVTLAEDYVSKSRLGTYEQCPFKFKLHYVDGITVPPNKFMLRGLAVHDFMENFHANVKIRKEGLYIKLPEGVSEEVLGHVKNVIGFEKKRWEKSLEKDYPLKYFKPVMVETKVHNHDDKLFGIVDRVHLNYDDELVVLDLKTGKYNSKNYDYYRQELAFYKKLLDGSLLLKKPVKYGAIYFSGSDTLIMESVSSQQVAILTQRIKEFRKNVMRQKFAPRPSILCKWCGYKEHCNVNHFD
ncbi:MAG: PD-(D/E)XK nuclease family protein [Nanoarchaeota archaeon]|nr:PD-(D/E)XK nuclease family protein [Nanoarchaeota archaeon]